MKYIKKKQMLNIAAMATFGVMAVMNPMQYSFARSGRTGKLERGENPTLIAKKYGIPLNVLNHFNPRFVTHSRKLQIGEPYYIPTKEEIDAFLAEHGGNSGNTRQPQQQQQQQQVQAVATPVQSQRLQQIPGQNGHGWVLSNGKYYPSYNGVMINPNARNAIGGITVASDITFNPANLPKIDPSNPYYEDVQALHRIWERAQKDPLNFWRVTEQQYASFPREFRTKEGFVDYFMPVIRQESNNRFDLNDPMQCNNEGDWCEEKKLWGLKKGGKFNSREDGLEHGVKIFMAKSFGSDLKPPNTRDVTYSDTYPVVLGRYNGNGDKDYVDNIVKLRAHQDYFDRRWDSDKGYIPGVDYSKKHERSAVYDKNSTPWEQDRQEYESKVAEEKSQQENSKDVATQQNKQTTK